MTLPRLTGPLLSRASCRHALFPPRMRSAPPRRGVRAFSIWSNAQAAHAGRSVARKEVDGDAGPTRERGAPLVRFMDSLYNVRQEDRKVSRSRKHGDMLPSNPPLEPEPHRNELPAWAAAAMNDPSISIVDLARTAVSGIASSVIETLDKDRFNQTIIARTLVVNIGDAWYKKKARASAEEEATRLAWLHVLAQLHARGELGFPPVLVGRPSPKRPQATKAVPALEFDPLPASVSWPSGNGDTILDVYHYSSGIGELPVIELRKLAETDLFEYTIALEKVGIRVAGVAKSPSDACRIAAHAFKQAAGKTFIQKRGKKNQKINASFPFSSQEDAGLFVQWLVQRNSISWVLQDADRTTNGVKTEELGALVQYDGFTANDQPLASRPPFWASNPDEARNMATFHGALEIVWGRSTLLKKYLHAKKLDKAPSLQRTAGATALNDLGALTRAMEDFESDRAVVSTTANPLAPARQTRLDVSHTSYTLMQALPSFDDAVEKGAAKADAWNQRKGRWPRLVGQQRDQHSRRLVDAYMSYSSDISPVIHRTRRALPVAVEKANLMELVDNNVYSILIGATGSGKTTQVPQLIFETWCRRGRGADCSIICTQPRIIAATSVASRVADELGPKLRDRVGYQVRNNAQVPYPRDGSITFCTTGILLQQLQHDPDLLMDNVSHLVLDEVHERDMTLDFTLAVLKKAVDRRLERGLKVPSILLMSATLDKNVFSNHFKNIGPDGGLVPAPSLSVPGRTFPVREKYLEEIVKDMRSASASRDLGLSRDIEQHRLSEEYIRQQLKPVTEDPAFAPAKAQGEEIDWHATDELITPISLIAETVAHAAYTTHHGAILVFLPGLSEIKKVEALLKSSRRLGFGGTNFNDPHKYRFFNLHSRLADSQRTVFQPVPAGVRKIVLSSPVAETSVTIPDVTCVIDSGQVRETHYEPAMRASWLRKGWINASSAKQRAGRAGRVQEGTYFALYSKARREAMPATGVPELMRADLQSTCLAVKSKIKDIDVPEFFATAIDPPKHASVQDALKALVDTGALTPERELTSLGRLLSDIPLHPSLGKMVVMGIIFKCLDPIIVAGAAIEQQEIWVTSKELGAQALRYKTAFAKKSESDLIATYNAFCYMRSNPLPPDIAAKMKHLRADIFNKISEAVNATRDTLVENGILRPDNIVDADGRIGGDDFNANSHNHNVVKAVIVAGLQANIGRRESLTTNFFLGNRPMARPDSFSMLNMKEYRRSDQLIAFGQLALANDAYVMRHVTAISPITAALFCGTLTSHIHRAKPIFFVNKFLPLPISVWAEHEADEPFKEEAWQVLLDFRKTLDQVLSIAFENLAHARHSMGATPDRSAAFVSSFVRRVVRVLDMEADEETLSLQEAVMTKRRQEKQESKKALRAALEQQELDRRQQEKEKAAAKRASAKAAAQSASGNADKNKKTAAKSASGNVDKNKKAAAKSKSGNADKNKPGAVEKLLKGLRELTKKDLKAEKASKAISVAPEPVENNNSGDKRAREPREVRDKEGTSQTILHGAREKGGASEHGQGDGESSQDANQHHREVWRQSQPWAGTHYTGNAKKDRGQKDILRQALGQLETRSLGRVRPGGQTRKGPTSWDAPKVESLRGAG